MSTSNDVSNIIDFIQHYWPNFSVTPQLIEHPTTEFVVNFYEHFHRSKIELIEDVVEQAEIESMNVPKRENDSIIVLIRFINQSIKNVSNEPLDMMLLLTDIYFPTAARTKVMLKILTNLLLWYEDNAIKLKSAVDNHTKQMIDFNKKLIEKEQNKAVLASKAEQHVRETDRFVELEKLMIKEKVIYSDIHKQKEESDGLFKKVKQHVKISMEVLQNNVDLLAELKGDVQYLTTQIVSKEHHENLQNFKNNRNQKLTELNTELSNVTVICQNRKSTFESLFAINKQLEKIILNAEELQEIKNILVDKEIHLKNLVMQNDTIINKVLKNNKIKLACKESDKDMENLLKTESYKNKILVEQLQETIVKINKELVEEEQFQQIKMNKKLALEEEISQSTMKLENIKVTIKNFHSYCENMYARLLNKENEVTKNFNDSLRHISRASSELLLEE